MDSQWFSIESGLKKGRPLPSWYIEEPSVDAGDACYLTAFGELSTSRSLGMGVGPIPWKIITEYGAFHGLDYELLVPFISIIMGLDRLFLERMNAKQNIKPSKKT